MNDRERDMSDENRSDELRKSISIALVVEFLIQRGDEVRIDIGCDGEDGNPCIPESILDISRIAVDTTPSIARISPRIHDD